jgi:hypothetical protein
MDRDEDSVTSSVLVRDIRSLGQRHKCVVVSGENNFDGGTIPEDAR